ncbi:hypothetical protein KCP74_13760 [Salmonella enterica subsp. enterica]|nr:hypothetical protein KCP74_13760 [Salmonella enterica subsp. enterica]
MRRVDRTRHLTPMSTAGLIDAAPAGRSVERDVCLPPRTLSLPRPTQDIPGALAGVDHRQYAS